MSSLYLSPCLDMRACVWGLNDGLIVGRPWMHCCCLLLPRVLLSWKPTQHRWVPYQKSGAVCAYCGEGHSVDMQCAVCRVIAHNACISKLVQINACQPTHVLVGPSDTGRVRSLATLHMIDAHGTLCTTSALFRRQLLPLECIDGSFDSLSRHCSVDNCCRSNA